MYHIIRRRHAYCNKNDSKTRFAARRNFDTGTRQSLTKKTTQYNRLKN